jgi:hypothetical protein
VSDASVWEKENVENRKKRRIQNDLNCTKQVYIHSYICINIHILVVVVVFELLTNCTLVGGERFSSRGPCITHNKNVGEPIRTRTEGILEDSARVKDNFRVVSRSLSSGRSVKVPLGKRIHRLAPLGTKSTCLGTCVSSSIYPNVLGQDFVLGEGKRFILGNDCRVKRALSCCLL